MAFDWKNAGDYVSDADVIGTAPHSSAPPTWKEFLWARPLVPRQRDLLRKRRLLLGGL